MRQLELPLFGFFFACWLAAIVFHLRLVPAAGTLAVGLYPLYALAAALGWIAGNVYVVRRRALPREHRKRAAALWLVAPQGVPAVVRAMAPSSHQAVAPLVPLFAFAVGAIFFCVPLVFGKR